MNKEEEKQTGLAQSRTVSLHPYSTRPFELVPPLTRLFLPQKKVSLRRFVTAPSDTLFKIVSRKILKSSHEQLIQARGLPTVHETDNRLRQHDRDPDESHRDAPLRRAAVDAVGPDVHRSAASELRAGMVAFAFSDGGFRAAVGCGVVVDHREGLGDG